MDQAELGGQASFCPMSATYDVSVLPTQYRQSAVQWMDLPSSILQMEIKLRRNACNSNETRLHTSIPRTRYDQEGSWLIHPGFN